MYVVKYDLSNMCPDTFKWKPYIRYVKMNREKHLGFEFVEDPKAATLFWDYVDAEHIRRRVASGDRVGNGGMGRAKLAFRAQIRKQ